MFMRQVNAQTQKVRRPRGYQAVAHGPAESGNDDFFNVASSKEVLTDTESMLSDPVPVADDRVSPSF